MKVASMLGKSKGRRTDVGCALGCVLLPPHLGTWDLCSQHLCWAQSALQDLAEKTQGINPLLCQNTSL